MGGSRLGLHAYALGLSLGGSPLGSLLRKLEPEHMAANHHFRRAPGTVQLFPDATLRPYLDDTGDVDPPLGDGLVCTCESFDCPLIDDPMT